MKLINFNPTHYKKRERGPKSIKSEMKIEKLQSIPHTYKGI